MYEQELGGITPEHAMHCVGCCTDIWPPIFVKPKKHVQNVGFLPLMRYSARSGSIPETPLMYGCCVATCHDPVW